MKDAINTLKQAIQSLQSHKTQVQTEINSLEGELKFKKDEAIVYDLRLKEFESAIAKLEQSDVKSKNKKA